MRKHKTSYEALELDKILNRLSDYTNGEEAASMARSLKPTTDFETVCKEITKTDDAFTLSCRFGTPQFIGIHSPVMDLKRAAAGVSIGTKALLNIASVLRQVRMLNDWRERCENVSTSLDTYFGNLIENSHVEKRIASCILSEDQIADEASEKLKQIRNKKRRQSQKAKDALERIVRNNSKYLQKNIVTMRNNRYVVPVKAEYRSQVQGLVHDTSSTGATIFIEPLSAVEANNEIRVLSGQEKDEIEFILEQLSFLCAEHAETINLNYSIILDLDLIFAKANLGAEMKATKPLLNEKGIINLKKARHPLIDKDKVVPIDVNLGKDFKSLIITGPNTGGKTVSLKTIGLLSSMAMCGLLIPARDGSEIAVFKKILVDIGDEQSIEQSLSTFSAHITNIASILEEADENSLVLIDELGSGTDPVEGAALATSIVEQIKQSGAYLVATTHYPELKMYAIDTQGVTNACCEFDVKTLSPTYKLMIGVPGQSNAFAISKRIGLSDKILNRAKELVSEDSRGFEKVVKRLETTRSDYEKELIKQKEDSERIKKIRLELEKKQEEIREKTDKEIENAQKRAKYVVDSVQVQANRLINEIEELKKQKDKMDPRQLLQKSKGALMGDLNKLYNEANPVNEHKQEDYKLPRDLKSGDMVLIYDINKKAQVLSPADKSGKVLVQMGLIKTRTKVSNLRLLENQTPAKIKSKTTKTVRSKMERKGLAELDLRGKNAEEALMELDLFIDSCVLSNLDTITIIHGKGTGVLRKSVSNHLKKHPSIKSYRLGVFGEGESGVTIAELK